MEALCPSRKFTFHPGDRKPYLGQLKAIYSEKMMNPASKIPPNRMSAIKINIGIGDSSFDGSSFSLILSTCFPAIKTSLNLSFLDVTKMVPPFIPFIIPFGAF